MSLAPVIPIVPQPRPQSRFEREARFLLDHKITPETLRLNAEAAPELAGWYYCVAAAMDDLVAPG